MGEQATPVQKKMNETEQFLPIDHLLHLHSRKLSLGHEVRYHRPFQGLYVIPPIHSLH